MQRIFLYFLVIVIVAAGVVAYRGFDSVTGRNIAIAVPLALLFAALIWLRWDVAPRLGRARRERERQQRSEVDVS